MDKFIFLNLYFLGSNSSICFTRRFTSISRAEIVPPASFSRCKKSSMILDDGSFVLILAHYFSRSRLTVCVTGLWADWVTAWEQDKPEARKMLVNRADSHKSSARGVRPRSRKQEQRLIFFIEGNATTDKIQNYFFRCHTRQCFWLNIQKELVMFCG